MVSPINYIQPDTLDQDLMQGIQLAGGIRDIRQARNQEQTAEQYKTDLQAALAGNNPRAFLDMGLKYPGQAAGLKQYWEGLGEEQRKSELNAGLQASYAINSDRPDIALGIIDQQAEAMKASGKDPSKILAFRSAVERDPKRAGQHLSMFLSSVAPKEFAETLSKFEGERRTEELHPAALKEADAKAESAAVKARFAESDAAKELELKGWQIKNLQNDINVKNANVRIASMNAEIAREENARRREELTLKRDEALMKRDEAVRGKVAEVESARMNIDNFLNTADRILATPMNVVGSAAGPVSSRMPTTYQSTADFEALVENMDAQAFLSQIPNLKGMGALSDAEGKKVAAALQNLSLKQSPERLMENVKEAQRLLLKARENVTRRYGVPETVPDTPAAAAKPASSIDALVDKYK